MKLFKQIALALVLIIPTFNIMADDSKYNHKNFNFALEGKTIELTKLLDAVSKKEKKKFLLHTKSKTQVVAYGIHLNKLDFNGLLQILELNQMAAVKTNGYFNIIPVNRVKQFPIPTITKGMTVENDSLWVTKVISVGRLDVGQLMPALRTLINIDGHLATNKQSNSLILVAPNKTVKRVEQIIIELTKSLSNIKG